VRKHITVKDPTRKIRGAGSKSYNESLIKGLKIRWDLKRGKQVQEDSEQERGGSRGNVFGGLTDLRCGKYRKRKVSLLLVHKASRKEGGDGEEGTKKNKLGETRRGKMDWHRLCAKRV